MLELLKGIYTLIKKDIFDIFALSKSIVILNVCYYRLVTVN